MVGGLIQMMNPKVFVTSTCEEASQDVEKVVATSSENDEQVVKMVKIWSINLSLMMITRSNNKMNDDFFCP